MLTWTFWCLFRTQYFNAHRHNSDLSSQDSEKLFHSHLIIINVVGIVVSFLRLLNSRCRFHSEKALYELPEDPVTAENIRSLAEEIEQMIHKAASAHAQSLWSTCAFKLAVTWRSAIEVTLDTLCQNHSCHFLATMMEITTSKESIGNSDMSTSKSGFKRVLRMS
jgi:hypothetical protein